MINIYPVDDFYCNLMNKKFTGEELTDYESSKLNEFEMDYEKKAINDASIIKNMLFERDAIAKAISSMEDKMISIDKKIEKLQEDLKNHLLLNDIKKIKTPFYDITICLNNPSTNIYNFYTCP